MLILVFEYLVLGLLVSFGFDFQPCFGLCGLFRKMVSVSDHDLEL